MKVGSPLRWPRKVLEKFYDLLGEPQDIAAAIHGLFRNVGTFFGCIGAAVGYLLAWVITWVIVLVIMMFALKLLASVFMVLSILAGVLASWIEGWSLLKWIVALVVITLVSVAYAFYSTNKSGRSRIP